MPLLRAELPHLSPPTRGKVRDVFDLGDRLLIVTTDRISAFDVVMQNGIPNKGYILNQISAFWFDHFDSIPNHILSTRDTDIDQAVHGRHPELYGRTMIARKAKPLPIECVARGFISGSLYKEYLKEGGAIHGLDLPDRLTDGAALPEPIFTPATKAQTGHDVNISFDQAADLVGLEVAEQVRDLTLDIYRRAANHVASHGLLLADTKFEFGLTDDGIIWIDEALTPDSSRYWEASQYQPGGSQPSFDKQYVRDYLESISWDKTPPGPTLPNEVVRNTELKYIEAYERITGRTFER